MAGFEPLPAPEPERMLFSVRLWGRFFPREAPFARNLHRSVEGADRIPDDTVFTGLT